MKWIWVGVLCIGLAGNSTAGVSTWYVSTSSSTDGPGTGWNNAFHTIQGAVNAANPGDTVLVTNGTYSTASQITVAKTLTLESVNGPELTIIDGGNAHRCFNLTNAACVISGFTITNGLVSGSNDDGYGGGIYCSDTTPVITNCTISGNSASSGGASHNGTLNNCTLAGNSAESYGGGSYQGVLNNCTLSGNEVRSGGNGGGNSYGTLNNCTLSGNSAGNGGGSFSGTLKNCTITGNSADDGGGVADGIANNCIVYHNVALSSGSNHYLGTLSYSCTTPLPAGTGNITNAPMLLSASHIHASSPCAGAGSAAHTSGTDIDGHAWASPPSMGCDEPALFNGTLEVSIGADFINATPEHTLVFSAQISGQVASNRWTFADGAEQINALYATHAWASAGDYDVMLTAWNDSNPGGVSATTTVHITDTTYYVNAANSTPSEPYTNWATAATTIQAAIDEAVPGSTVWVTNGVYDTGTTVPPGYACSNRVVISIDITVQSVNGPAATFIVGAAAGGGGNGYGAVRGVYMSDGTLSGFTITNGHTMTSGDWYYDRTGGGISMKSGDGVVNHCTISGNSANTYGGGSYYGTLNYCTISGNSSGYNGGGSYESTLNNCVLTGNSSSWGGGSHEGTLNNCTLTSNTANNVGGSHRGTLNNSIIYFNTGTLANNTHSATLSHSCTPDPGGSGNITNAPQFAASSDFLLAASSPCINAGTNAYVESVVDLDGHPRIVFGTVDMGAYEYIASSNDYDGDGMDNDSEAAADTDSTDPGSVLAVVGITQSNGQQIVWTGGIQARQFLETKCDLVSTTEQWTAIYTNEPDTPITNVFDLPLELTNSPCFYRIRVE